MEPWEGAFSTDKYYYPLSFSGTTQSPAAATMTDFAVGTDTLEFTIHAGSASASQLSGYGIVVPLALEAGKSYTFAAKCASANSGVNLMTYNVSGGVSEPTRPMPESATAPRSFAPLP